MNTSAGTTKTMFSMLFIDNKQSVSCPGTRVQGPRQTVTMLSMLFISNKGSVFLSLNTCEGTRTTLFSMLFIDNKESVSCPWTRVQGPRRRILCDRSGQEAERGVGAEGPQPFLQAGGTVRPLQEEQRRCQRRRLSGMRRHLFAGECILMRRHLFVGECIPFIRQQTDKR